MPKASFRPCDQRGRVASPELRALRVGPCRFDCGTETDGWQPCGPAGAPRS